MAARGAGSGFEWSLPTLGGAAAGASLAGGFAADAGNASHTHSRAGSIAARARRGRAPGATTVTNLAICKRINRPYATLPYSVEQSQEIAR